MEELLSPVNSVHAESFARLIVSRSCPTHGHVRETATSFCPRLGNPASGRGHRARTTACTDRGHESVDVLTDFMKISGNRELDKNETELVRAVWEQVRAEYEEEAK